MQMQKIQKKMKPYKLFLIFAMFLIILYPTFGDITNDIAGNSTLIYFPQNLSLSNTSRTLIGTDLFGTVNGNPAFNTSVFQTNQFLLMSLKYLINLNSAGNKSK